MSRFYFIAELAKSPTRVCASMMIALLFWCSSNYAAVLPPKAAIASAAPQATEAGFAMLEKGGNAFDAAIAVASVLAVVEPYASGIGGGGFWLLYTAKDDRAVFLDAREMAPLAATKDMYVKHPDSSLNGPLSAAIPGEPAALVYLAAHYGKLPLRVSLAPAIKLAREGFAVFPLYQQRLRDRLAIIRNSTAATKIFLLDNEVPPLGHLIIQQELAHSLELLAQQGTVEFYQGKLAQKLVREVNAAGGIWQLADLKNYRIFLRQPLVMHDGDMTMTTVGLPSGGGISLVSMLKMLAHFDWQKLSPLYQVQLNLEIMRRAFWDRARYLGDPEFVNSPVSWLLSDAHITDLVKTIIPGKATPSAMLQPAGEAADEGNNTTHYSILDREGNRVSATLSINYYFGSGFVVPGTGILLNDEMDDFSTNLHALNIFGVSFSPANQIAPGKRPLSSMAPVFLETPNKLAILGAPGGSFIPTMMLLAIEDFLQGHLPASWVSKKRYHHQYVPDEVQYEPDTFTAEQETTLREMGYTLTPLTRVIGDMQAVLWNKQSGEITVASDPRRRGKADSR